MAKIPVCTACSKRRFAYWLINWLLPAPGDPVNPTRRAERTGYSANPAIEESAVATMTLLNARERARLSTSEIAILTSTAEFNCGVLTQFGRRRRLPNHTVAFDGISCDPNISGFGLDDSDHLALACQIAFKR